MSQTRTPPKTDTDAATLDGTPYKLHLDCDGVYKQFRKGLAKDRHDEQRTDMAGRFVGLMPPRLFMDQFMPVETPIPVSEIPKADFSKVYNSSIKKEEQMYAPFVSSLSL